MNTLRKNGLIALAVVCVVWGTTYFALRIGVKSFPPLLFSGIRQILAAVLLFTVMIISKRKWDWTLKNVMRQFAVGFLLICMGNGLVGWAEVYIPSGLAALIASLIPLNIVVINLIFGRTKTVNLKIVLGILFGLAGMVFIFKDNIKDLGNPGYFKGLMMSLTASVCWSAGTIFVKKYNSNNDTLYHNTALQFLFGGVLMSIIGFLTEDKTRLSHAGTISWLALVYLAVFGSILALLCYHYAIKTLPVSTVALYAYVNPFIAVLLGCTFLDEKFTRYTAIAFILTLTGIYLVNAGNQLKKIKSM